MTSLQLFITFLMGIIVFDINHKLKRIIEIKIIINTLFELYDLDKLKDNDPEKVYDVLSAEILQLEKMHDNNFYVKTQINKLNMLRLKYKQLSLKEEINTLGINQINFKRLDRKFIVLCFFNPKFLKLK